MRANDQSFASITLDSGLLSGISLRYPRPLFIRVVERLAPTGPISSGHPELKLDYPHLETDQTAKWETGSRRLRVRHVASSSLAPDQTIVTFSFNCEQPMVWKLEISDQCRIVGGTGKLALDHAGIEVRFAHGTSQPNTVLAASTGHAVVSVEIPSGSSRLTIGLTHFGDTPVAKIALIVAPGQMKEAAMAMSLIGGGRYIPIFEHQPPPISREKFFTLRAEYHEIIKEQNTLQTKMRLGHHTAVREIAKGLFAQREYQARIGDYRGWLKRNSSFIKLLGRNRVEKVLLFDRDALNTFYVSEDDNEEPLSHLVGARSQDGRNPETGEPNVVLLDPGTATKDPVADCARLRGVGQMLTDILGMRREELHVAWDDTAQIYAGLQKSLFEGKALSIAEPDSIARTDGADARASALNLPHADANAGEVVVIDQSSRIRYLAAISYAVASGCDIVIIPERKDDATLALFKSLDRYLTAGTPQEGANAAVRLARPMLDLARKTWRRLNSSALDSLLLKITLVTNKAVPDKAAAFIGSRAVTAFTPGGPLHFYNTPLGNWVTKPIGHMSDDADIGLLIEMTSRCPQQSRGIFSVFLDSGYFVDSETEFVFGLLKNTYSAPIVVEPDFAFDSGRFIAMVDPEIVFFNTHGFDGGILLGTNPVPFFQVANWWKFASAPLIFNNSCISWRTMSAEFLRAGARGYIGTLWSVRSEPAARIAEEFSRLYLSGSESIASALAKSRTQDTTGSAYVYAGVASAAFPKTETILERHNLSVVLEKIELLSSQFGERSGSPLGLVYKQFKLFEQALTNSGDIERHAWVSDLAMAIACRRTIFLIRQRTSFSQDEVLARHFNYMHELKSGLHLIASIASSRTAGTPLGELPSEIGYMHAAAMVAIASEFGDGEEAITWQRKAVRLKTDSRGAAVEEQCKLARLYLNSGKPEEAFAVLDNLKVQVGEDEPDIVAVQMGNMVQTLRRMLRNEEALALCEKGLEIARAHKLGGSAQALTIDKINILASIDREEEALELCRTAVEAAYADADAERALILEAQLGQLLATTGKLEEALEVSSKAANSAHARNDRLRYAALLVDLSLIHTLRKEHEQAVEHALTAAHVFLSAGHSERLYSVGHMLVIAVQSSNQAQLAFRAVAQGLALATSVDRDPAWILAPIAELLAQTCAYYAAHGNAQTAVAFVRAVRGAWKEDDRANTAVESILDRWLGDLLQRLQGVAVRQSAGEYAGYEYLLKALEIAAPDDSNLDP